MNSLTLVYLGIVLTLVILFMSRKVLQRWLVWFARGLLVLSICGSLLGAFTMQPFVRIAEWSLEQNGTLESLREVDQKLPLEKVIVPVQNLFEKIKSLWQKNESTQAPVPQKQEQLGVLEAELYPTLVATTASFYRSMVLALSLLGLVLSVYLNFSSASITEIDSLQKRLRLLEDKMQSNND